MVVYDEDDVETTVMLEEKRAKAQAKSTTAATTAADTTAAATAAAPSPTAAKPPSAPDKVGAGEAAVQGPREAGKALESVRAFQKLQEQRVHTYRDFEECVVAPLDVHDFEQWWPLRSLTHSLPVCDRQNTAALLSCCGVVTLGHTRPWLPRSRLGLHPSARTSIKLR